MGMQGAQQGLIAFPFGLEDKLTLLLAHDGKGHPQMFGGQGSLDILWPLDDHTALTMPQVFQPNAPGVGWALQAVTVYVIEDGAVSAAVMFMDEDECGADDCFERAPATPDALSKRRFARTQVARKADHVSGAKQLSQSFSQCLRVSGMVTGVRQWCGSDG
jgi:hypothetical protein